METRTHRFCRLIAERTSGRVRWCLGNEESWKTILKILVILTITTLTILIASILYTYIDIDKSTIQTPITTLKTVRDSELSDNEDRELLPDSQTSFIPHNFQYDPRMVKKRITDDDSDSPKIKDFELPNFENLTYEEMFSTLEVYLRKHKLIGHDDYDFWKHNLSKEEIRKKQANIMLKYMDRTVNPCDNFYKYACGNWESYNPIPADKLSFDPFEILRENIDVVLKDLLLEPMDDNSNDFHLQLYESAVVKAKNLYRSCINEELLEKRGGQPLLDLLQILGGWPILESHWNETEFDWLWLVAQLRLYNNDILLSEWVGPDIKNSDEYIIQFDQPTLGLPTREYFLDPANFKYLQAYRVYMITITTLLGSSIRKATDDVNALVLFEIELAKIMAGTDSPRNVTETYTRVTVGELEHLVPQIDWKQYLNLVLGKDVLPSEPIVCFSVSYLQNLVELLSITPKRTVSNYILWRFVRHRINNLDSRFQEAKQRFYYALYGREKSPPRWQTCVSQVNNNMGMAMGSLFVERFFDKHSKNDTVTMTREIQQSFRDLLSELEWLDPSTKSLARVKLDAIRLRIGYPDYVLNQTELSDRYKDVEIRPNLYFENTLSILKHLTRAEQSKLGHFVNKSTWNAAPATVNAYYSRNKNQIIFPAGILQPPFYHRYFPKSLNYGGIGVVIGHEITHGFDDKGRLFDKDGNLQRWWQDYAIQEFQERTQCLIDQYNGYVIPDLDLKIDGENTQGENIADNGGIKQSFKAYQRWLKNHPDEDESLPDLNLTPNQLFFLNFAQVWCGTTRPEASKSKLKTDVHSPGQFRVIGTVSNSYDFAETYRCPLGSPMNPKTKCSIW